MGTANQPAAHQRAPGVLAASDFAQLHPVQPASPSLGRKPKRRPEMSGGRVRRTVPLAAQRRRRSIWSGCHAAFKQCKSLSDTLSAIRGSSPHSQRS